jgi:hypothetical protein
MATPRSQKADQRPISFVLSNDFTGRVRQVIPPIRPEDLSRNENSLMEARQTFGGAFIDDFGRGLSSINISGHTGWRGAENEDGVAAFDNLRDLIWASWHADRKAAVEAGQSPDVVKLIFADALDGIVNVVAPGSFNLKRNRARPLLMMYSLNMTVLSERVDPQLIDSLNLYGTADRVAGAESILDSVSRLEAAAANVRQWVAANIAAPVRSYLNLSTSIMNRVVSVVRRGEALVTAQASQLIGIARDLSEVGRNIFRTFNAIANFPDFVKHQIMEVASAFDNVFCVLNNLFRQERTFPDYSGLYGASNCSSTVGGSPLSPLRGENAFESIIPASEPPPTVTAAARTSISAMKVADPVLSPPSMDAMAYHLTQIGDGVALA